MADLFSQATADAAALGITPRQALALEFVARAAWAHVAGNARAEATLTAAASHAAGNIDGETMRQCFAVIDGFAPTKGA